MKEGRLDYLLAIFQLLARAFELHANGDIKDFQAEEWDGHVAFRDNSVAKLAWVFLKAEVEIEAYGLFLY